MTRITAISSLVLLILISAGCSRRRTRQFIIPQTSTDWLKAGDWELEPPAVVAFKDIIDLKKIADTTMFWVSMKARRLRSDDPQAATDLTVDSISVVFAGDSSRYWRKPTRISPYNTSRDKYIRKIFDFFGNQGIIIPAGIDTITVEFEAVSMSSAGQVVDRYPMIVELVRDEKALKVPLLQQ